MAQFGGDPVPRSRWPCRPAARSAGIRRKPRPSLTCSLLCRAGLRAHHPGEQWQESDEGRRSDDIERTGGVSRPVVIRWRNRYLEGAWVPWPTCPGRTGNRTPTRRPSWSGRWKPRRSIWASRTAVGCWPGRWGSATSRSRRCGASGWGLQPWRTETFKSSTDPELVAVRDAVQAEGVQVIAHPRLSRKGTCAGLVGGNNTPLSQDFGGTGGGRGRGRSSLDPSPPKIASFDFQEVSEATSLTHDSTCGRKAS